MIFDGLEGIRSKRKDVRGLDLEDLLGKTRSLFFEELLARLPKLKALSASEVLTTLLTNVFPYGLARDLSEQDLQRRFLVAFTALRGTVEPRTPLLAAHRFLAQMVSTALERLQAPKGWTRCAGFNETCVCEGLTRLQGKENATWL